LVNLYRQGDKIMIIQYGGKGRGVVETTNTEFLRPDQEVSVEKYL
jgi:hypothetical protein